MLVFMLSFANGNEKTIELRFFINYYKVTSRKPNAFSTVFPVDICSLNSNNLKKLILKTNECANGL